MNPQVIRSSLVTCKKTLLGQVAMSSEIEKLTNSIYIGNQPAMWDAVSYPKMKPLSSYHGELIKRLRMLQSWMDSGPPVCSWISGFFFTHAFLTGNKLVKRTGSRLQI
jgi:dynein heavy chain